MNISKLSLKNFGLIKQCDLKFNSGFTILSGNIGQGKSHLLSSIAFMLVNEKKDTFEDYLNWEEDEFNTFMSFQHRGRKFKFETSFDRKANSVDRSLTVENHGTFTGSSATSIMADYFDPKLTRSAIIAVQGESDLVTSGDANRREILKKIQSLDFSNEAKEVEEEIKAIEAGELKEVSNRIVLLQNKEYEIKPLLRPPFPESKYKEIEKQVQKKNDAISNIEREIEYYQKTKERVDNLLDVVESHNLSILRAKGKLDETTDKIESLNEKLSTEDFGVRLRGLKSDFEALSKDTTISDLEDKLKRIQVDLKSLEDSLVPFDQESLDTAKKEQQTLIGDLASARKSLEACKNGECPTCGKEFSSQDTEQHENQIEDLDSKLQGVERAIALLEKQKEELSEKKYEINRLHTAKENTESEIDKEKKRLEEKQRSLQDDISHEESAIEEKKQSIRDVISSSGELKDEYQKTIDQHMETVKNAQEEATALHSELPDREPVLDNTLVDERDGLIATLKKYDEVMGANEQIRKSNEKTEQQKKKDSEELAVREGEKRTIENRVKGLKNCVVVLKREFPNYVINRTIKEIETGMNLFLDKTYNGRYHVSIEENKNGIKVGYGKRGKDIRLSSGGEQDLFNLGLKIALARKAKLDILLLDEIDKFWSTEQARIVFSTLQSLIDDGKLNQVIVISHNDYVKEILESDFRAEVFHVENGDVR